VLNLIDRHSEPFISIDELKASLRITASGEDDYLLSLAETACMVVQEKSGKMINVDAYDYILSAVCDVIKIPLHPVSELTSINYFDSDNVSQVLDLADVEIVSDDNKTLIKYEWPSVFDRSDAVTIQFATGYPETMLFPDNLKHAAILLASHWYENRTAANVAMYEIPYGVETLVNFSKQGWY